MGESEELLDVLDDAGEPIGQKSRAQIHRDHDRHGLVFVWSAWESEGRQYLLLQRRGSAGDPFLGRADALAGGHIGAGETSTSAGRRELIEEVGLQAGPKDLIHLGSGLKLRPIGNCRRVVQHHLLYRGAYQSDPSRNLRPGRHAFRSQPELQHVSPRSSRSPTTPLR